MNPIIHINDPNLVQEIEALFPLPTPDKLIITQSLERPVDFSPDAIETANRNEALDQEVQRPNQRAAWQLDFELRQWAAAGRTGPLPHAPAYVALDAALHHKWWVASEETKNPSSPTYAQNAPKHDFVVSLPSAPMPTPAAAALPPPPDPTVSPVGAAMGPGYFGPTPFSRLLPDGQRVAESRSYTGFVTHVVFSPSPFYPNGLDFWMVSAPPA